MSKPRQTRSGKWELAVRHPSLPGGRKYLTFDSEEAAVEYGRGWKAMKMADLPPPAELMAPTVGSGVTFRRLLTDWEASGHSVASQKSTITRLLDEVGKVRLVDADYKWLAAYVQWLKTERNISPHTITIRIQGLAQAIDHYLRHNPEVRIGNVTRLLPKGYARYSDKDRKLVKAAGKQVRVNTERERRLRPGEEERITAALSGQEVGGRPNRLQLRGGNALLTLFTLIMYSGLRLLEAYRLKRGDVDLDAKKMRVQKSKLWHGAVQYKEVPLRREVHEALKVYLSTRPLLPSANLFPFMDEEAGLEQKQVTNRLSLRFSKVFAYAGCEGLTEHDLRHEATCRWYELRDENGGWMYRGEEIKKIMGWSPNSNMAARYASFRAEDLAERLWQDSADEGNGQRRRPAAA